MQQKVANLEQQASDTAQVTDSEPVFSTEQTVSAVWSSLGCLLDPWTEALSEAEWAKQGCQLSV